jgi:hypothetical protein
MRSPVKSNFALLILLHIRTSERVVEDLASFLHGSEQVSTTSQSTHKQK